MSRIDLFDFEKKVLVSKDFETLKKKAPDRCSNHFGAMPELCDLCPNLRADKKPHQSIAHGAKQFREVLEEHGLSPVKRSCRTCRNLYLSQPVYDRPAPKPLREL